MPRPKLSHISVAALQAEIKKRMSNLPKLIAQRDELNRRISELQGAKAPAAQVAPARKVPKAKARRAGGKPLGMYVADALAAASKGLSVKEIERAVLKAGYPTAAKSIYNPIMKVLGKGGFKKVRKGVYAAASAKAFAVSFKASLAAAKPQGRRKRGTFSQTANEFILGLIKNKGQTTAQINKAWTKAGRAGKADKTLNILSTAKKIKREKLKVGKGSTYTVA